MQQAGNAGKPDPQRYISKLRSMTQGERLAELIHVNEKLKAAHTLGIFDLVEYYGEVRAWLALVVSCERMQQETERPDIFGFYLPPYTTDIA